MVVDKLGLTSPQARKDAERVAGVAGDLKAGFAGIVGKVKELFSRGDFQDAFDAAEEAKAEAVTDEERFALDLVEADCLHALGRFSPDALSESLTRYGEVIEKMRACFENNFESTPLAAVALANQAAAFIDSNRLPDAKANLDLALPILTELFVSEAADETADEAAKKAQQEAKLEHGEALAFAQGKLGIIFHRQGKAEQAVEHLQAGMKTAQAAGIEVNASWPLRAMAELHAHIIEE